jgi:hypothetical protein
VEAAAQTFPADDARPLKVFFQDEARFGRMSRPVPCWAPEDLRPLVPEQRVREFTYVYSAACPQTGDCFSLILPGSDTEQMQEFLDTFCRFHSQDRIVMVMDNAAWHTTQKLSLPENLRLHLLPPYSPELNPVEHLWDEVREKDFANRAWNSLEEVEDQLETSFRALHQNPQRVRSITGFPWAIINI